MRFVELLAKTNYSFLEGASHPEEMVDRACAEKYEALGIADRNGAYAIPRAHVAAKRGRIKLIVGAEVRVASQSGFLIARSRNGYGNLCELLSTAHASLLEKHRAVDPPLSIPWEAFLTKQDDLFLLLRGGPNQEFTLRLKEILGDRLYFVANRFFDGHHQSAIRQMTELSREFGVPCVASNEPLYHSKERKAVQDVLTCIRHTKNVRHAGFLLQSNSERYLKTPAEMRELFKGREEWLENSAKIADACQFSMDEIRYRYPNEWLPAGETSHSYLRRLVEEGVLKRYGDRGTPKVRAQLETELQLIKDLNYEDFFLTIWDIVQFARGRGILCQGRGSAANSLVCYVLSITAIDPVLMDLLFERFLSKERNEPPDIDIDFEHERREEVIQYIYERYGRRRAAITAEVICFRKRSAFREVAKVFSIPEETVKKILVVAHREKIDSLEEDTLIRASGIERKELRRYLQYAKAISGFPRHLGTHVGGFVLCQEALDRNVPIEKAAMEGRTIVQWDKDDLDSLGFVRVDVLGLGILTAIRKTFESIKRVIGKELTLANLTQEDPNVYELLSKADTIGVFQIESRAQMSMLPRLKPKNFYDIVVEVAIMRPGPIHGDMVHPYLRRRAGTEKVDYTHAKLESILKKTFGVPIFQEQVMKMAMEVGGFTGGEADELRRSMGKWKKTGTLHEIGKRFKAGLLNNGINEAYADRILKQVEGFAEYGFPESHAASFALLAYATAYLKCYYPAAFLTGLLNSQPMGFYSAQTLIYDANRHGVKVLPVDVQLSHWDNWLVSEKEMRLGYREIHGLSKQVGLAIETESQRGHFTSFLDFVERVKPITKRDLFHLAGSNAFDSLGIERRAAFWEIQGLSIADSQYLTAGDVPVELPKEKTWEGISLDYEAQGVCLSRHPMDYWRRQLDQEGILSSQGLRFIPHKKKVKVGGIVICRQMPATASGVLFITLEDEYGFINLVVWNQVQKRLKEVLLTQSFLMVEGRVEKSEGGRVTHVIVEDAEPLLPFSVGMEDSVISHDFH